MNEVILLGRLGADPELKTTSGGGAVCKMRVATNRSKKVGDTWEELTDWHSVVAFGKTAENAAKYLKKGKQVLVEGKVTYHKHEDKYYTDILADVITFIGDGGKAEPVKGDGGAPDESIPF